MEFQEVVRLRRMVRTFTDEPVPHYRRWKG
jgi:hypothetical protein